MLKNLFVDCCRINEPSIWVEEPRIGDHNEVNELSEYHYQIRPIGHVTGACQVLTKIYRLAVWVGGGAQEFVPLTDTPRTLLDTSTKTLRHSGIFSLRRRVMTFVWG